VKRLVKNAEGFDRRRRHRWPEAAPFIGIACPGVINEDGSIAKGAQNLPGIGRAAS